jgi:hypothetical protein
MGKRGEGDGEIEAVGGRCVFCGVPLAGQGNLGNIFSSLLLDGSDKFAFKFFAAISKRHFERAK